MGVFSLSLAALTLSVLARSEQNDTSSVSKARAGLPVLLVLQAGTYQELSLRVKQPVHPSLCEHYGSVNQQRRNMGCLLEFTFICYCGLESPCFPVPCKQVSSMTGDSSFAPSSLSSHPMLHCSRCKKLADISNQAARDQQRTTLIHFTNSGWADKPI